MDTHGNDSPYLASPPPSPPRRRRTRARQRSDGGRRRLAVPSSAPSTIPTAPPELGARDRRRLRGRRTLLARDRAEGIDLARSGVPLPGDLDPSGGSYPVRRMPSLRRQEAFCDESTLKPRLSRGPSMLSERGSSFGSVPGAKSASFGLDNIVHGEPAYPYAVRSAKRQKKNHSRSERCGEAEEEDGEWSGSPEPPRLDLSFADLARDDRIARYLATPEASDVEVDTEEDESDQSLISPHFGPPASSTTVAPLHVIYELDDSANERNAPGLVPDAPGDHDEQDDDGSDSSFATTDGDDAGEWSVIGKDVEVTDGLPPTPTIAGRPWVLLDDDGS